jgi:hypothetical protein
MTDTTHLLFGRRPSGHRPLQPHTPQAQLIIVESPALRQALRLIKRLRLLERSDQALADGLDELAEILNNIAERQDFSYQLEHHHPHDPFVEKGALLDELTCRPRVPRNPSTRPTWLASSQPFTRSVYFFSTLTIDGLASLLTSINYWP